MRTTTTTIFALLGLASTVAADLYIFQVMSNFFTEGGTGTGDPIHVYSNRPNCKAVNNAIPLYSVDNDASSGGFACDGCDKGAIVDWPITRFEMYDGPDAVGSSTHHPTGLTSGTVGHITLRPDGDHFNLVWVSLDGKSQGIRGTCQRPAQAGRPAQDFACFGGFVSNSGVELFHCKTDLTSNVG